MLNRKGHNLTIQIIGEEEIGFKGTKFVRVGWETDNDNGNDNSNSNENGNRTDDDDVDVDDNETWRLMKRIPRDEFGQTDRQTLAVGSATRTIPRWQTRWSSDQSFIMLDDFLLIWNVDSKQMNQFRYIPNSK